MLNSPYQLKRDARNPLYQQIASNLRLQITSGQISQGDFLAPEKELSQEMGVNHITLRKALMVLEGEGLITRKRKVGTVVLAPSFWKLDVAISKIGILVWNEAELSEDASSFCRQITSQEMTPVILRGDQDDLREQIRENGIHGLIIFPTAKAANIRLIDSIKMPKLLLQYVTRVEGMDNLVIDSFPGVYGGVKQLLNFGHRDFIYIGGLISTGYDEAGQELFLTAQDSYYRLVAMRQALSEARIPFSFNNCFEVPFEPGNTDRILQQLIDENRMPTAFVCFDDVVAVLLLESLTALGLEVPKDVSVLGFGDVVEGIDLATATIDTNDMAELAVARIRERISQGGLGGMTLSVTSAFKPGGSIGPVKTTK